MMPKNIPPTPWTYECAGDVDGDLVGYDHFVMDANGEEIVTAPTADTANLFAAAPEMLAALEAHAKVREHLSSCRKCGGRPFSGDVWFCSEHDRLRAAAIEAGEAAIKKAKGE